MTHHCIQNQLRKNATLAENCHDWEVLTCNYHPCPPRPPTPQVQPLPHLSDPTGEQLPDLAPPPFPRPSPPPNAIALLGLVIGVSGTAPSSTLLRGLPVLAAAAPCRTSAPPPNRSASIVAGVAGDVYDSSASMVVAEAKSPSPPPWPAAIERAYDKGRGGVEVEVAVEDGICVFTPSPLSSPFAASSPLVRLPPS